MIKKFTDTDIDLKIDMDMEINDIVEKEKKRREAEAYNDKISRDVVGRLFDDYVKTEEKESLISGYDDFAEMDESPYEDDKTYNTLPMTNIDDTESNVAGILSQEEYGDDKTYIDYINSMTRTSRNNKEKYLQQPESVKQITQRQQIIKARKDEAERKYNSVIKKVEEIDDYDVEEYGQNSGRFDGYNYEESGIIRILKNSRSIFGIGGIVILSIFMFLVFKINSISNQLEVAKSAIEVASQTEKEFQSLKIENEGLKAKIAGLEKDGAIDEENNTDETLEAADSNIGGNNTEQPNIVANDNNITENTNNTAKIEKYTVKQGDTFWSIAQKVYGDGNKGKDIMIANNISNEQGLKIGTELIIP